MESIWAGARLTEIREACRLSRKELAELIGTSPANVTRWEADDQEPKATHLWAIADALKVTLDTIRQKVGEPIDFIEQPDTDRVPRGRGRPPKPKPADDTITDDGA